MSDKPSVPIVNRENILLGGSSSDFRCFFHPMLSARLLFLWHRLTVHVTQKCDRFIGEHSRHLCAYGVILRLKKNIGWMWMDVFLHPKLII